MKRMENFECDEEYHTNLDEIPVAEAIEKNGVTANDASKIVDVNEEDEAHDLENDISNRTFTNPSQVDKYCSDKLFRCEICDFASARKDTIEKFSVQPTSNIKFNRQQYYFAIFQKYLK